MPPPRQTSRPPKHINSISAAADRSSNNLRRFHSNAADPSFYSIAGSKRSAPLKRACSGGFTKSSTAGLMHPDFNKSSLRDLFPITKRYNYLNHAAVSPLPSPTVKAVEAQLRDVQENGSVNFQSWIAVKEHARRLLAGRVAARPEQVAFMRNPCSALSTVANGVTWHTGDNIVTFRGEFPSNLYPWLRIRDVLGVELRMCEERDGRVEFEDLAKLVD